MMKEKQEEKPSKDDEEVRVWMDCTNLGRTSKALKNTRVNIGIEKLF